VTVKLLLDENLSEHLLGSIGEMFPGSAHARKAGGSGLSDRSLWDAAGAGGYVLTTRDEDFVGLSVLRKAPPKVIWLNVGNARNAVIAALLQSHGPDIENFAAHDDYTFLAIGFYTAKSSR
jgi:predicted nuclease of predicted toxin-antitoxin system